MNWTSTEKKSFASAQNTAIRGLGFNGCDAGEIIKKAGPSLALLCAQFVLGELERDRGNPLEAGFTLDRIKLSFGGLQVARAMEQANELLDAVDDSGDVAEELGHHLNSISSVRMPLWRVLRQLAHDGFEIPERVTHRRIIFQLFAAGVVAAIEARSLLSALSLANVEVVFDRNFEPDQDDESDEIREEQAA
ncbi:MAG: hypothetical protein ABIH21_03350 [Patescibacteria group bacterium]